MMPISALPTLPAPLPVLPAAPAVLDFTALLQGGPVAAPTPAMIVSEEGEPLPASVAAPDIDEPAPDAEPLPAPPPILAMLHAPVPAEPPVPAPAVATVPAEAVAVIDAAPREGGVAPRPDIAAPPPVAPHVASVSMAPVVSAVDPAPVSPTSARQSAAPIPVPAEAHKSAEVPAPPVPAPSTVPVAAAAAKDVPPVPVALPIQPDAPRPARAASALPPLPASAPTVASAPPASPVMQEVPSSPPPVEVQALVADATTPEPPAAPDQPAAPLPQPVAAAPAQRPVQPDALQPPIDTTDPRWIDRMAQEIADLANGDGRARFRLNPETLGSMEVTVRHTADGISIRFEVDNESTRTLLAHTEQRLQAEARANGLRIADTQVDLAQQQNQRGGRERPAEQPLIAIRTATSESTTTAESAPASARYA